MIIRIVRMHFTPDGVDTFLKVFEKNKAAIWNFEGCTHLELLKDVHDSTVYTTLSYWQEAKFLEAYRKSALFEAVWRQVKPHFSARTQAFSLEKFIEL